MTLSRAALESLPSRFEGRIALIVESMRVSRVRVFGVHVSDDVLFANYEVLETPGLDAAAGASAEVSAARGVLFASDTYWSTSYVGWRFFFDPEVVRRVLAIVAAMPAGKTYSDDYTSHPAPKGSRFSGRRTPGPCAAALHAYLQEQSSTELRKRKGLDV